MFDLGRVRKEKTRERGLRFGKEIGRSKKCLFVNYKTTSCLIGNLHFFASPSN